MSDSTLKQRDGKVKWANWDRFDWVSPLSKKYQQNPLLTENDAKPETDMVSIMVSFEINVKVIHGNKKRS